MTVYQALPFIRELPQATRQEIASESLGRALGGKPFSRVSVSEIIEGSRLDELSHSVTQHLRGELLEIPIRRLIPVAEKLRRRRIAVNETSTRLFNILLRNDLLTWDRILPLTPNEVATFRGSGRKSMSELISLAIRESLELTTVRPSEARDPLFSVRTSSSLPRKLGSPSAEGIFDLLDEYVSSFPAASLALGLRGVMRRTILSAEGSIDLGSVRRFLAGQGDAGGLSKVFNTARRTHLLEQSLQDFYSSVLNWIAGDIWDSDFKWLLRPGSLRARDMRVDDSKLRKQLERASELGRRLSVGRDVGIWLPFISVEGILEIKRFRASDTPLVVTAVTRGSMATVPKKRIRPWDVNFPSNVALLPLAWSFQYSPVKRMETVLGRLRRGGYANVGHLRALHPEALSLARRVKTEDWIALRTALNSSP